MLCLALGLAGCASEAPQVQTAPPVEAAYVPDPNDPLSRWVPHIREASQKYDMPEKWIRAVMMRESNGRATTNSGKVLTSSAGAIGLMQVMPGTYELMRVQYGLGPNPADPHDNIMAGTAYLREMYDLFGAPGFLAAYNCGPACYAQHLAGKQRLPRETKMYLAALTPVLRGTGPREPSQAAGASAIEVAVVPDDAPKPRGGQPAAPAPQRSEPAPMVVASAAPETRAPESRAVEPRRMEPRPAEPKAAEPAPAPAPVVMASLPEPAPVPAPAVAPAKPVQVASLEPPATTHRVNPQFTTQVAEALLPPQSVGKGERVVMRFVSQRADGCGSLAGRDRACVTLADAR
ncbi:transglycosylase SLT domain-containing protein [Azospirillum lipoferum]|uniref:Transglycosylase SLT domain-containing protein n=2 Tax=Azospirillaceae TaxID=2829815 RepID=A0A5A9GSP0_AZOLI|nr:lytic transglycosylase domain-containing protein [Azospirillum lipoferum]KAA0597373.1 transglycosylase SLT domain-containing protein [Azospirillum lipoferum]